MRRTKQGTTMPTAETEIVDDTHHLNAGRSARSPRAVHVVSAPTLHAAGAQGGVR